MVGGAMMVKSETVKLGTYLEFLLNFIVVSLRLKFCVLKWCTIVEMAVELRTITPLIDQVINIMSMVGALNYYLKIII